jgi:6,7-dimethyl-8-ribityllumazine synthase
MTQPTGPRLLEGDFSPPQGSVSVAIVAARFNDFVVDKLLAGAVDGLVRHGLPAAAITVVRTPGAVELPLAVQRLAKSGKFGAILALGAVIRGSTPHFDYVCNQVSSGCAGVMMQTGVPVIFGVLTTDTIEQAVERSGTKAGNKGFDAALAAIEMINLGRKLSSEGL